MRRICMYILLFYCKNALSQSSDLNRTKHWYFGNKAGIDFSSGFAVADTNGLLSTYEGCATISDTLGNLLFYTDGDTIWNKMHQPMTNGYGLLGCPNFVSGAQSATIIPKPGSDSLYFLITNGCQENSGIDGLRYSIVDISLNGGLGDVTLKNILLFAPSTEGTAATYKCNKKDIWVVAHEPNNNNFRIYSIDSNGIDTVPNIISIGSVYTSLFSQFRFSSDGEKLAAAFPSALKIKELFSFDNEFGIISNPITLTGFQFGGAYSPEFSFDNSKLYFTMGGSYIYQFDISSGIDSIINNSFFTVAFTGFSVYGHLIKAPDNKIYVTEINKDSLGTINNPNASGSNCAFVKSSFYLNRTSRIGLPQFVSNYYYQGLPQSNCITGIENTNLNSFKLYPNPTNDIVTITSATENIKAVELVNLLGETLLTQKANTLTTQLNIQAFPQGFYFVKITGANYTVVKKVMKE